MDCQSCQPSLVDLLYGELAPDVSDAAHAHLQGCDGCRDAYERLRAGHSLALQLPLEEPPARVSAELMQLAVRQADQRKSAAAAPAASTPRGPWAMLLELVGRLAMAPQVGMATIMLLIVAVGLWSVPRLTRAPQVAGEMVVNPDPGGEAAGSMGLAPAEPLDLRVDLRRGRIHTKGEAKEAAVAGMELEETANGLADAPAEAPVSDSVAAPEDDALAAFALDDLDDLSDVVGAAPRAAPARPGIDEFLMQADEGEPPEPAERRGEATASAAEATQAARTRDAAKASVAARPAAGAVAQAFPHSPYRAAAEAAAPAPTASAAGLGATAARASTPVAAGATDEVEPKAKAKAEAKTDARASALDAARQTRRQSGCAAALPLYQRAIDGAGRTRATGEALIEMAQCQRELGRPGLAESLLRSATQVPAVATRARALLAPARSRPAAAAAEATGEPAGPP